MSSRREFDQRYSSEWRSIVNFMKNNTGFLISGVAKAGSRRRGDYKDSSDLDIIFAVSRDPPKTEIYPKLEQLLKDNFPKASIEIGRSYNVIKMSINSLNFDIVLRTKTEFESQIRDMKIERL